MSVERVKEHLAAYGAAERTVREFDVSSATVELAAKALGCEEARIAKTLSFMLGERVILVVAAGDVKVDNRKYKDFFGGKAKMLAREDTERLTGHAAGGVCPFAVSDGVEVWLDESPENASPPSIPLAAARRAPLSSLPRSLKTSPAQKAGRTSAKPYDAAE